MTTATSGGPLLEHAWYINLDRREDKRRRCEQQLKKLPTSLIAAERFSAIDGRKVDPATVRHIAGEWTTSRGHLGCLLSHYELYKRIQASDCAPDRWFLILEDDFEFHPAVFQHPEIINTYVQSVPPEAGLVKWTDSVFAEPLVPAGSRHDPRAVVVPPSARRSVNEFVYRLPPSTFNYRSTGAYMVRKSYVEKMLKSFPRNEIIDILMCEWDLWHFHPVSDSRWNTSTPTNFYLDGPNRYYGFVTCRDPFNISDTVCHPPLIRLEQVQRLLDEHRHREACDLLDLLAPDALSSTAETVARYHYLAVIAWYYVERERGAAICREFVRRLNESPALLAVCQPQLSRIQSNFDCYGLRSELERPLKRRIVTFSQLTRHGGVGNQLFQLAALVSYGARTGREVVVPPAAGSTSIYDVLVGPFRVSDLRVPGLKEHKYNEMPFQPIPLYDEPILELWGHYQALDYIDPSVVLPLFRFREEWFSESRRRYGLPTERSTCSIHIRRGDYVKHSDVYLLLGPNYYREALQVVESRESVDEYYVFSDEIGTARELLAPFAGGRAFTFVEPLPGSTPEATVLHDLHLMTLCRHHIVANSTLSWWGAWLGRQTRGVTVAPRQIFAPRSTVAPHDRLYPCTWHRLEVEERYLGLLGVGPVERAKWSQLVDAFRRAGYSVRLVRTASEARDCSPIVVGDKTDATTFSTLVAAAPRAVIVTTLADAKSEERNHSVVVWGDHDDGRRCVAASQAEAFSVLTERVWRLYGLRL